MGLSSAVVWYLDRDCISRQLGAVRTALKPHRGFAMVIGGRIILSHKKPLYQVTTNMIQSVKTITTYSLQHVYPSRKNHYSARCKVEQAPGVLHALTSVHNAGKWLSRSPPGPLELIKRLGDAERFLKELSSARTMNGTTQSFTLDSLLVCFVCNSINTITGCF